MTPRRTRYATRNQGVLRNRKSRFHTWTEIFSGLTERCDAAFLINSCPPFLTHLPGEETNPASSTSVQCAIAMSSAQLDAEALFVGGIVLPSAVFMEPSSSRGSRPVNRYPILRVPSRIRDSESDAGPGRRR